MYVHACNIFSWYDNRQETSEHLLAAILNLSARDSPSGHGAVNGGVNFAEQTSQDILEVGRN